MPRTPIAAVAAAVVAGIVLVAACTDRAAPQTSGDGGATGAAASALTNRVWIKSSPDAPLGSMLMFLSDGTLVQDSCWETYRLSKWRADAADTLRWQEDTAGITATVVELTPSDLTLRLDLASAPDTVRYHAAAVPYVCPDLPR